MQKNKISSYLLAISLLTFISVFVIVVSKSYDNLMSSAKSAQNNSLGKLSDLNLNTEVINVIESRSKAPDFPNQ